MTNLTLSVPDELYKEMKKHLEIRWSEVARQALAKKVDDLRRLDALLAGSALRERDVEEVGRKVKERVWKKHQGRAKRKGLRDLSGIGSARADAVNVKKRAQRGTSSSSTPRT